MRDNPISIKGLPSPFFISVRRWECSYSNDNKGGSVQLTTYYSSNNEVYESDNYYKCDVSVTTYPRFFYHDDILLQEVTMTPTNPTHTRHYKKGFMYSV